MNSSLQRSHRIVFCITELDVGGAEKALVRIVIGLKGLGWDVSVVSLRDRGLMAKPLEAAGVPVTALNCGWFGDLRAIFRLRRHLRTKSPAVLVCFLHQANIVGRIVGRWLRVSYVLSGVRVADSRRWVVWSDRLTRRLVSHYVAVSESVAELHSRLCGIPRSKITAIPNGVDLSRDAVHASKDSSPGEHCLLYVGRLTVQKSPQTLVEAFLLLPEALRDCTTVDVIGTGPASEPLQQLITQHGLQDRIRLLGHRDDVPACMRAADLLVLPSKWEGLPNVVLEAMAHRLPVVASSVDGVRDVIRHEQTGWLVESGDAAAFARTIATVLQSPNQRATVADSAYAMVAEHYSWDAAIQKYDELLRGLSQ